MSADTPRALEGVRVLEVCQVMAGPFCCTLLADMGADVVKVENPDGGDQSRQLGRHFTGGEGHGFMNLNRNKRGIALNLKLPGGQALLKELAARADVLVENLRPGTLRKIGLGYEDLRKVNPGLVYASISGYGQTGPFKDRGGFDLVSQGLSSLLSFTGEPDRPPAKIPVPLCDLNAGIYTAFSILCACLHKQRTGRGQYIDTALTDAGLGYTFWQASQFFPSGEPPVPRGSAHEMTAPYQALRCKDGYLVLGAASQATWERTCKVLGREDLIAHPDYLDDGRRSAKYQQLARELEGEFAKRTRDEWIALLDAAKVPCGPILDMAEAFAHPQIRARGMAVEVDHPKAGRVTVLGFPPKLSETPGKVRTPAPTLGQHTDEVLREAGKSEDDIRRLRAGGVVA
ncbi:MAG: CoA transferase [Nitrospinota bacterium]